MADRLQRVLKKGGGSKLMRNTALLTGVSLYMRAAGLLFQIYISNKIGAAGVGLFTLVLSVQALAVTLATSGIRYAVTRLLSEEAGLGRNGRLGGVMHRSFAYSAFFSITAMSLLYLFAERIGTVWIGDERTILPIRIMAFGLPFLSLTSVMGGYFTAVSRVYKSSAVQVLEQLAMMACAAFLLSRIPEGRIDLACQAIVLSGVVADAFSFAVSIILYLFDKKRYKNAAPEIMSGTARRLLNLAFPLALSAYARVILSTLQHLMVPGGLKKSGEGADGALSAYGIIQGMAFPLITFPAAFFYSLSELLIPELTEAQVKGDSAKVESIVKRVFTLCLRFSIACAGIIYAYGGELGAALYNNPEAGRYIKLFAPLIIIMYLDTVADGMLKGLGQQLYSMGINIADAFISVVLVYFLLPVWAIPAYIAIIFVTELINFVLSFARLSKLVKIHIPVSAFIIPLLSVFSAVQCASFTLRVFALPLDTGWLSASVHIALSALFYLAAFKVFGINIKGRVSKEVY